jgi:hypothetical protein
MAFEKDEKDRLCEAFFCKLSKPVVMIRKYCVRVWTEAACCAEVVRNLKPVGLKDQSSQSAKPAVDWQALVVGELCKGLPKMGMFARRLEVLHTAGSAAHQALHDVAVSLVSRSDAYRTLVSVQ